MSYTNQRYRLRNLFDDQIVEWSLEEILHEINRDRSEGWQDYDANDWREGLAEFTEWALVAPQPG